MSFKAPKDARRSTELVSLAKELMDLMDKRGIYPAEQIMALDYAKGLIWGYTYAGGLRDMGLLVPRLEP